MSADPGRNDGGCLARPALRPPLTRAVGRFTFHFLTFHQFLKGRHPPLGDLCSWKKLGKGPARAGARRLRTGAGCPGVPQTFLSAVARAFQPTRRQNDSRVHFVCGAWPTGKSALRVWHRTPLAVWRTAFARDVSGAAPACGRAAGEPPVPPPDGDWPGRSASPPPPPTKLQPRTCPRLWTCCGWATRAPPISGAGHWPLPLPLFTVQPFTRFLSAVLIKSG